MFIGHFGVGFASKKIGERVLLGTLFMAAQFVDLIWPLMLLFGWEKVVVEPGNTAFTPLNFVSYPITHSLVGVIIWGILFGSVYYFIKKNMKNSLLLGLLVVSHWVLDLIVHRPDLPLLPWINLKVGFGLWNSVPLSILIEGLIFLAGVFIYMKVTRANNKKGSFGLWGLIGFLIIVYVMNIVGPPPESSKVIGYVGLLQWLLVWWAYWIDRNRSAQLKM